MQTLNQLKIGNIVYDLAAKFDAENNNIKDTYFRKDEMPQIEQAVTEAENVNATITEENIFEVTDRNGEKKTLNLNVSDGTPAGFGEIAATVDNSIGTPSVTVTTSGTNEAKNFIFEFTGLKGEKGDKGEVGMQGNSGVADASNKTLVNDAITGGETDFLSAEIGKLGILTYDCSKGGSVTHATLQDAINSVPTTFQKVGLTITYKSSDTIYRYTLNANVWSSDPVNWFSVEDKLSDLERIKMDKTSIAQTTGDAEDKVMSQKATTSAIADETTRAKAAEEAIIFDVSVYNNGAVFESLQALLSSSNLSTLIPTSVRHGGMSIRFVQSSDNKYVSYRLMADEWSTNTDDWAIVGAGVYVDNPEFIDVKTDKDGKILWAIKIDGSIYWGAGVPQQVIDYIEERIAELSIDEYEDIVAFLNGLEEGDKTLQILLDERGKFVENPEYIQVLSDKEGKILEGITSDGVKEVNIPVNIGACTLKTVDNPEYLEVKTDKEGKILSYVDKEGNTEFANVPKTSKDYIERRTKVYKRTLDAVDEDNVNPFILGSQLVVPNVSVYDKNLGEHNTFAPDKLYSQFNFPSNAMLPNKQIGKLQSFIINENEATIMNLGNNYIYLTDGTSFYRVGYTEKDGEIDVTDTAELLSIDCDGLQIYNVFETNDGNLLVECNGKTNGSPHKLYKATIQNVSSNTVNTSSVYLFTLQTDCNITTDWSIKQYGNNILVSPYAHGRTAQIWWSDDYGDTFNCILNLVDDDTYVSTKPNGSGYGATGIHPEPSNLIPQRPDDFWDLAQQEGNGNMHIHSTCYDEYFNRIWWVGGDDGGHRMTGIYWTDDFGKTWNRMSVMSDGMKIDLAPSRGNMQMLQVVSLPNCVLFASDGWGSGIFRYNRYKKNEEPVIEFAYGFTSNHGSTVSVAQSTLLTNNGLALLSYAPDRGSNPQYSPTGGVVATDGYHFKEILTDTYNEGDAQTIKLHWHIPMKIYNGNLYVLCSNNKEIIFTSKQF